MHKTMQQKAAEAHNMCKLKGDSMLDNSDRQIAFEAVYDNEDQAQQAVKFFTEKAKSVETEACTIQHSISPIEDGFLMQMQIEFSCQAEVALFQMAVR
ncbi:YfcZ/YiiS family protein [Actinobacillus arthritidis]|uniref:YfcZ/YiiS family protein n=1 Tax=Actinobacillus arthritidis TaxID=157339 RepID=UPI002442DE02|nr:YfcZ/YiiS family protein [Actinobacillus arthritidis]WGE89274.1 YfcZ/YiiS family protein [Actinobacillus arthritidis]